MRSELRALAQRVLNLAVRGVVGAATDTTKAQGLKAKLRKGEVDDGIHGKGIERFCGYGFTSVPLAGAELVVLHLGGSADHPIVVQTEDRRYRLKSLEGGEVALYDDQGQRVHLARPKVQVLSPDANPIRLGVSEGGAYEALMLYPDCNADLSQIQTQFTALVTQVNAALAAIDGKFAQAMPGSPPSVVGPSGYAPATAALSLTTGTPARNAEAER
jgi:phage baseplate assembly protein V